MLATVESTHKKIFTRISLIKQLINDARCFSTRLDDVMVSLLDIEREYMLAVAPILHGFYTGNVDEWTKEYHRMITRDNLSSKINIILRRLETEINSCINTRDRANILAQITGLLHVENMSHFEQHDFETCSCGNRMVVDPEHSELKCEQCLRIKSIVGTVFKDEQFYPQDGQKSKHGGYDTSRHFRFWMERLQALEQKSFTQEELAKIEYVLVRDMYDDRTALTCEIMRKVLKDNKVGLTKYNDHAPLLMVIFGGPVPPRLSFEESRRLSVKFNKVMKYYDEIITDGRNKPYFPYFILKLLEDEFAHEPDKLRLVDYIHLQTWDTVVKNDLIYKQICERADASDRLIYKPTDPCGRL
jgi:hypothetical protein